MKINNNIERHQCGEVYNPAEDEICPYCSDQDEIQEDTTSMEEKLIALEELDEDIINLNRGER